VARQFYPLLGVNPIPPSPRVDFYSKKINQYVYPQIRQNPAYGKNKKKLRRYKPETWRYRIGKFRLFYSIDTDEKIIYVLSVDLRKDAYRKMAE